MLDKDYDTFPKLLLRNCQKWPHHVAMRKKDFGIWKEYTWTQCYEKVKAFSLGLISLGLEKGDKVAIIGENEPEWFWAEFAAQAARAIMVGIYTDMVPSEVKYIAEHSKARFAIANDQEQVDKFLEITDQLDELEKIIYWDPKGLRHYDHPALITFEEVMRAGKAFDASHPGVFEKNISEGSGQDIAALYYTSGTTGLPKAGMVSHAALIISGTKFLEYSSVSSEDDIFSYLPAAWIGEGLFGTTGHMVGGVTLNFAEEPETVQEDLREIGPHLLIYGPRQWEDLARTIQVKISEAGMINRLLYKMFLKIGYKRVDLFEKKTASTFWDLLIFIADRLVFFPLRENFGLRKCRVAYTGSAAMSVDTFRFWSALGISLRQIYASTEAGFVSGHTSDDIRFDTVGKIHDQANVKISEDEEILVSGPCIFSGYYNDPEKTKNTMRDGWVHTGDAGLINKAGHLVFLDRLGDLSELSDGSKYAPQYIEGRLRFSPYIKDAMVLGGKERDYLSVIIIIDFENVGKWAEENHLNYTTFADLSQKMEVARLLRKDLRRINADFEDNLQIKKFVLLHKEFDPDEEELTRTRKLRRGYMEDRYTDLVNGIYDNKEGVDVESVIKYRDGRETITTTNIRIRSAMEEGS